MEERILVTLDSNLKKTNFPQKKNNSKPYAFYRLAIYQILVPTGCELIR